MKIFLKEYYSKEKFTQGPIEEHFFYFKHSLELGRIDRLISEELLSKERPIPIAAFLVTHKQNEKVISVLA